ncbi:MAG: helix-turn-helix transcriptional regulator [Parvularculaceae bacterium]|nr:helix-turn-helix transcriptional regulator [Parvularculaceae bacterium]
MINRLRELRESARMTQKSLGDAVDVSRQAINALETGKHAPSLDLAYKLAALFQCTVEDIFTNPYRENG